MVEITIEVDCDFDLVNVGRCSFGRRSLVLSWLRVFWFRLWVGFARSLPPSISFSAFRACIYSLGEFCSLAPCGIISLLVGKGYLPIFSGPSVGSIEVALRSV